MKIVSVVGARPQFIKASPISRVLRKNHTEILVHSGQHYDESMSDVFFEELQIPRPDFNLGVGSNSHGHMTGEMLGKLEDLFVAENPDAVLVYGDTNTTLAASLAAVKLHIPIIHIEAGLRAFDKKIPEEVNRIMTDHVSTILFAPTEAAIENLSNEGIVDGVFHVGDVMLDTARHFGETFDAAPVMERFGVKPKEYYLATLHRPVASDFADVLEGVIRAFGRLEKPVIWAIHPRTQKNIAAFGLDKLIEEYPNIIATDPLPYGETMALLRNSFALITDSGGMQKEAYFFKVPCIAMRPRTEWVETVESGWNKLVGYDEDTIVKYAQDPSIPSEHPDFYGDGHAAEATVKIIEEYFGDTEHE